MKKSELIISAITVPLDYLVILFSAIAAYKIRFLPIVRNVRPVVFDLPYHNYLITVLIIAVFWILIFALAGLYNIKGAYRQINEISKIFLACAASMAAVMAAMFFTRYLFDSRLIIIIAWTLCFIFVSFERLLIRLFQKKLYETGIGVHRVILIGKTEITENLIKEFSKYKNLGYQFVKQYANFNDDVKTEITELANNDKFDEIIQTDPELPRQKVLDIINLLSDYHLDFKYTADLLGAKLSNYEIKTFRGMPLVEIKRTPLDGWGRIFKRIFDIIFSIMFIIIFLPLMILAGIAIKIDSVGPILFKYKRVGQRGRPFDFIKFRSMVKDAHLYRFNENFLLNHKNLRAGTPMMKFKNDPRITRVGKFIRRWSIDELPQFFLVLAGKMSLVGPRPHEPEEIAKYDRSQRQVLALKPGITGLAQVSGRSDLDFNEEIKLDTYYIENWSLKLDLQILFKTPLAVLQRREAD